MHVAQRFCHNTILSYVDRQTESKSFGAWKWLKLGDFSERLLRPSGKDSTRSTSLLLKTVKQTPQLKDQTDYYERMEAFQDAFVIDQKETKGKRLLLFDDLYRSGATVR